MAGVITQIGGRTAHSAIIARTLGIPAIMGVENITKIVKNGDLVAFDGDKGEILINPKEEQLKEYQNFAKELRKL